MLLQEIFDNITVSRNPLYINNIKSFIKKSVFDFKQYYSKDEEKKNVSTVEINIFDYHDSSSVTSIAHYSKFLHSIWFDKEAIERIVTLLDKKNSQEAWVTMLVAHELYHSIYFKKYNEQLLEYESRINSYTRAYLTRNTFYKYKDIKDSVARQGLLVNNKNKYAAVLNNTLLFKTMNEESLYNQ